MKNKKSKRIVIDTTVAQASGQKGSAATRSGCCRETLSAVLEICHQVIMTPDISDEWRTHQSRFTRIWRVSMEARKKVRHITVPPNIDLRERVMHAAKCPRDWEVMLKDFHLIEAALVADGIIVSLDDTAVCLFRSIAGTVGELRRIVWVNPENNLDEVVSWLADGADSNVEGFVSL